MVKIAIIGAGGALFLQSIIKDILLDEVIWKSKVVLMDIDAERLEKGKAISLLLAEKLNRKGFDLETTTSLEDAVANAKYVIAIFRCGELRHQEIEYAIPAKYGVRQAVADTLGPGGIFRGLRTLKALFPVLDAMERNSPGAYLFNYVNPMSINTIALSRRAETVKVLGFCHSVQGTARQIGEMLGIPREKIVYRAAGVNHLAFMLKLEAEGRDLYPELRKCLERPEIYNRDKVRFEIMRHFGCFPTEGSGHNSEYVPYFRKRPDLLEKYCSVTVKQNPGLEIDWSPVAAGVPGSALDYCRILSRKNPVWLEEYLSGKREPYLKSSSEYAAKVIAAIERNIPAEANLNVMNDGLIDSLPSACAVEVPCLISGAGVFPTKVNDFPEPLAALIRNMTGAQILAAEGALSASRELIRRAVSLDPLTAAVLSLDECAAMTDEMFEALKSEIDGRFSTTS